jgi:benzoyl-CoA reductase/2-hydroxyglutaryl-CoA dehydratase subunit BcrC/BadD/HgdB
MHSLNEFQSPEALAKEASVAQRLVRIDSKINPENVKPVKLPSDEPSNQLEYIERSRQDHSYSKGVGKLFDMALSYMGDAEKGNLEGKPAVWSTGLMEAPLLYACDTVPMAVYDLGRLGSSDAAIGTSEEMFDMPQETCSMVTALLGEWYLRRNNSVKKVVALSTVCEPLNMAYEMIREYGFDIHRVEQVIKPVHGGEERLDQMVKFLTSELADVAVFLSGKPVDEAKMAVEIARMNRLMAKFREILALRVANPLYIKSLPTLFLLMGSGHYYGKPEQYEALLDELIVELTNADFVPSPFGKIIPLTWVGARGLEFGVYKAVDDLGGALLSWFTPNPYDRVWREDIPPLEAMARFILEYFVTGSPVNQIKYIEKMIEESGSKGMLFYTYIGCPYGGLHVELFRDYFQKKGVPSSGLEGSWQVGAPSGQLITRVRAFIEMLS